MHRSLSTIQNQRGSMIVFAMSAIAVMSITAALLTTATIYEVKKTANVERAALARYQAESGIEDSLFILRRALAADKTVVDVKRYFGFANANSFSEVVACTGTTGLLASPCEKLEVKFGVASLRFNMDRDTPLILDLYNPENINEQPWPSFRAGRLAWSDVGNNQYEVTFIPWDISNPLNIKPLTPIKRLVWDELPVSAGGDGSNDDMITIDLPCASRGTLNPGEDDLCEIGSCSGILGKVKLRLLSASPAYNLSFALYNSFGQSFCDSINGYDQCIPGFFEITSIGRDAYNKQALRIVSSIPGGEEQTADIWDYAIFSGQSLSK